MLDIHVIHCLQEFIDFHYCNDTSGLNSENEHVPVDQLVRLLDFMLAQPYSA